MHDSAQYRYVRGQLQRSKEPQQLRGLNQNHNHKQLGLALPLGCAAGQSKQTNIPTSKNEVGLNLSRHTRVLPRGGEKFFP